MDFLHHLIHLAVHNIADYFDNSAERRRQEEEERRRREEERRRREEEERKKLIAKKTTMENLSGRGSLLFGLVSLLATVGCGYYCIVKSFNWFWLVLCIIGIVALLITIWSFVDSYSTISSAKKIKKMTLEEFKKSPYNR